MNDDLLDPVIHKASIPAREKSNIRDVWEGPGVDRTFAALASVSQAKVDLRVKEGR